MRESWVRAPPGSQTNAPLAQLVERCFYMADVASSSLAGSTNTKLGFLVVTVLTMVSKLQDSSKSTRWIPCDLVLNAVALKLESRGRL